MTLLDFARGPALQWSIIIFIVGVFWRLIGVWALRHQKDLSEPRVRGAWKGGLKGLFVHLWPYKPFRPYVAGQYLVGYIFHIGLAVVVFFFVPHILFFEDIIGVSWPGLPNGVIYFAGGVTIVALVVALVKRLTSPVLRQISNFDDYAAWFVTIAPVVTGMMANGHLFPNYETLLAVHILSVELLLIYFPFGKLMHSFWFVVSRWTTGTRFERRGGLA